MILCLRFAVSHEGFFRRVETTEINLAAVGRDLRLPLALPLARHAGVCAGIVSMGLAVLLIFSVRRFAQIANTVPCLEALAMADLMLWPASIPQRPHDPVDLEYAAPPVDGDGNTQVALTMRRPCEAASEPRVPC